MIFNRSGMMLFAGNSNPALSRAIAAHLQVPLGKANVSRFSDGEIMVEIAENVRARDVFVFQSICRPTNDNLMELMVLIDALRRASAASITAVIPYLGYARQDRRPRSARVPITAKVVANMIAGVGTDRVLTVAVCTSPQGAEAGDWFDFSGLELDLPPPYRTTDRALLRFGVLPVAVFGIR